MITLDSGMEVRKSYPLESPTARMGGGVNKRRIFKYQGHQVVSVLLSIGLGVVEKNTSHVLYVVFFRVEYMCCAQCT